MYSIDKANNLLDVALNLSSLGLQTFPCQSKGKAPLTKHGCKDATKDPAKLEAYFKNKDANIACATGEPSGAFVIDVDDMRSLEQYETMYGKLPVTWLSQTPSGGYHYWFRATDRSNKLKNAVKFFGSLDTRTSGGYALLPPSIGENGKPYVWLMSPDKTKLADCPLAWIESMPSHDVESKGKSKTLTIQRAKTIAERAVAYLNHVPVAISGSGGHGHTFSVACRLIELFGNDLCNEELLLCMEQWNSKCLPPWTEQELRHKLEGARTKTEPIAPQDVEDVSLVTSCPKLKLELSQAAYVGVLGDIVRAIEPETEADIAGVLFSLLVGIGNIVGKRPTMKVTGDIHYANLYLALVGDTASGKGQAWGVARYILSKLDPPWVTNDVANGLSSGEGLVERVEDPKPNEQEQEPKHQALTLPPERRLLCLETEFSKPIGACKVFCVTQQGT